MGKVHRIKRKIKKIVETKITGRHSLWYTSVYFGKSHYGKYYFITGGSYSSLIKWCEREYLGGLGKSD